MLFIDFSSSFLGIDIGFNAANEPLGRLATKSLAILALSLNVSRKFL